MKTLLSIVGPTASGKTGLSIELALKYAAPVVSADSVQIYRGLDIGSGKVSEEEGRGVPHYMIDVADPCEDFSAGIYGREVDLLLPKLFEEREVVLLVGGAGFYLKAVWEGFDEMPEVDHAVREALNREFADGGLLPLVDELRRVDAETFAVVDRQNPMRVIRALEVYRSTGQPISAFRKAEKKGEKGYREVKIGLAWEREALYARINERVEGMLAAGLEAEVRSLWEQHGGGCKGLGSVGYREWVDCFEGKHDREEAVRLIKRNSRRYAKRQLTWFKKHEDIKWFPPGSLAEILEYVDGELAGGMVQDE